MKRKNRFTDLLWQTPLALGFLAIAGVVTYLIIMLLRWVVDLSGAVNMLHTVLVGVAVFIGLVLFVGAAYVYMQKLGANDAVFMKNTENAAADVKSAAAVFVICLAVYGALLWLLSEIEWDFFSGPAAYISAALNYRWGTPFDTARLWCRAVGYAVLALSLLPAMLAGYKKGFLHKSSEIKKK